jgi:peptide/nickel transport system permease protein
MTAYVIRRILYAIPIVIGVNLITFALFFFVNTPDDMARAHLGAKRVTEEQIARWKRERGYQFPYFYNDGWAEIEVRQVSGGEGSLRLPAQRAGAYRLRVEVPKPDKGTLEVKITTDDTARLVLPRPSESDLLRFDVADQDLKEAFFHLEPIEGEYHSLTLAFHPSKEAPLTIVRLYFKEDRSLVENFTETIFWKKSIQLLFFRFGTSDDGRNIGEEIRKRIRPSLAITIPIFLIGLFVNITVAGILAFYRGTYLDFWGVVACVVMMSISILFYVIGGQWLLGKTLRLVPVSGYDTGLYAAKFVLLPVVIGVIGGIGNGVRWYRTIYLEEMGKDYVRTARAKGLPESVVLYKHTLKNAMIPILTGVVVTIPFLFIGSLVLESFFAIPGMGSFTLEAIQRQDFAIVQAMVFLGSVLYIVGLIMTDISYTLVDPRIRLE